jgi:hypothetical protein
MGSVGTARLGGARVLKSTWDLCRRLQAAVMFQYKPRRRTMDSDLLKTIATYGSLAAVFVSVLNLTSQIRRHTQSLRSQNYAKALDRLAATQSKLGTDAAASSLFSRGVRDPSLLSPIERAQLAWILYEIFGAFEFMYQETKRGTLPPEIWERWALTMSWWLSFPGVRIWWRAKPSPFTKSFSMLVESQIENPIHDADAATNWQEFMKDSTARPKTPGAVD